MLTVLYFARLRETLGVEREQVALPPGIHDIGELTTWLRKRGAEWSALDLGGVIRCAVNQEIATANTPIADGDEVAYFPPVTGG